LCTGPAVKQCEVVGRELRGCERAEHELRVEAQQVECARSFRRIERAERVPAFRRHHVGFELVRGVLVAAACFRLPHRLGRECPRAAEVQGTDAVAHVRIGVLREPIRQLHQVTVGVVEDPTFGIGHALILSSSSVRVDRCPAPARTCADLAASRGETDVCSARQCRTMIEFAGRDGNRLAADVAGDPLHPPVVLLHGGGQTRHSWGTTLTALAATGWCAYAVDLRGHGESEWAADGDYTLDAFAGDVVAIARALDEPPALVGASLGGLASLAAIGERPDERVARALVLVDVAPRTEEQGRERIGSFMAEHMHDGFASLDEVADAIQRYNPHRPRPSNLGGLEKNLRRGQDGRWYWHWDPQFIGGRMGGPDETRSSLIEPTRLEAAARTLTVPTLLVRGRVSDLLSEEGAQEFLAIAPHAQMVDVTGAGHMVAGDRNDLFNDAVVTFLDAVRGP
jgi:pimeloyl-ACP methyl ester carboxylesterase